MSNHIHMELFLPALMLGGLALTISCERSKKAHPASTLPQPSHYQISKVANSQNLLLTTATYSGVLLNDTLLGLSNVQQELPARVLAPVEAMEAELILTRCTQQGEVRWYWRSLPHADTAQQHYEGAIYPLSYYQRQYRGFSTATGQRVVWINAFPKNDPSFLPNWKTEEVSVEDGGKAYFNIYINLDSQQCFNFLRNSIGG